MKKIILLVLIVSLTCTIGAKTKPEEVLKKIEWLGQATIKIVDQGKVIYIDPYKLKSEDKGDYILITHGHADHLSIADLNKVVTDKSVIVAPTNCLDKLKNIKVAKILTVEPGSKIEVGHISLEAVPAYNIKKTRFHPKTNKWVGYILNIDGNKVYHAGDTELIPEMKNLDCDVAFLPLGQTYTMNSVEDAVQAAIDVKAEVAVPIHYGMYEGKESDAIKFKELLKDKIKVVILNQK